MTVGPGNQFFSWLGHSGILVKYPSGELREFDYGVVFDDAATTRAAMTGTAKSYLAMRDGRVQLSKWIERGRTVTIQRLYLTDAQTIALIGRLVSEVTEKRGYQYDLLSDNCTTRARDLIDSVTDGALRRAGSATTGLTLRQIGYRQIQKSWVIAGFEIIFNKSADHDATAWEASLFPSEFGRLVAATTILDRRGRASPLVQSTSYFGNRVRAPSPFARDRLFYLLLGCVLGCVAISIAAARKKYQRAPRYLLGVWAMVLGLVLGLPGTVVGVGWFLTEYPFVRQNENLLLLNPLLIVIIPIGVFYAIGRLWAIRAMKGVLLICIAGAAIEVAIKCVPGVAQDNWRTLFVVLPPLLTTTWASFYVARTEQDFSAPLAITIGNSRRDSIDANASTSQSGASRLSAHTKAKLQAMSRSR